MLQNLHKDLGGWKLTKMTKQNLITWGLTTVRAPSVMSSMLATLSGVLATGADLFHLKLKRGAGRRARSVLKRQGFMRYNLRQQIPD